MCAIEWRISLMWWLCLATFEKIAEKTLSCYLLVGSYKGIRVAVPLIDGCEDWASEGGRTVSSTSREMDVSNERRVP